MRRYVRDAGPLLTELNVLTRCDCTTRDERKAARLATRMDELEARIAELAAAEELAAIRPELDGHQVMEHLGIGPGPLVGEALRVPPRRSGWTRARSVPPPRTTASTPGTPSTSPDAPSVPATQAVGSHRLALVDRIGDTDPGLGVQSVHSSGARRRDRRGGDPPAHGDVALGAVRRRRRGPPRRPGRAGRAARRRPQPGDARRGDRRGACSPPRRSP